MAITSKDKFIKNTDSRTKHIRGVTKKDIFIKNVDSKQKLSS